MHRTGINTIAPKILYRLCADAMAIGLDCVFKQGIADAAVMNKTAVNKLKNTLNSGTVLDMLLSVNAAKTAVLHAPIFIPDMA